MLHKNTKCRNAFLYNIFQHAAENSKVNCELFSKTDFSGDRSIFSNFIKRYNMSPSLKTKKFIFFKFREGMAWNQKHTNFVPNFVLL